MTVALVLPKPFGVLAATGGSYLRLPERGNWLATIELTAFSAPPPGTPATISILPESTSGARPLPADLFVGSVRRSRVVPGSQTLVVSLVGGAGQLLTQLPPADQIAGSTVLPAGLVLRKIVDLLPGERLAAGVEKALDAYLLPRWHRAGGTTARDAIDALIYDVAAVSGDPLTWRVLADGSIWAGIDTHPPPPRAAKFNYVDQDPDDGVMIYAPSGAPLRPGQTIDGERAVEVEYTLASPALRARVRHVVPGDAPRLASSVVTDLYRASYGARVEAQRDDGTLDIVCDDPRMGDLLAVDFRLGIPGCKVTMPAGPAGTGSRVRVRFENASPRGAYACDVNADPTPTHALSLVGDACGYLTGIAPPGGGPVTLLWSPTITGSPGEAGISIVGPGHKYVKGVSG